MKLLSAVFCLAISCGAFSQDVDSNQERLARHVYSSNTSRGIVYKGSVKTNDTKEPEALVIAKSSQTVKSQPVKTEIKKDNNMKGMLVGGAVKAAAGGW